MLCETCIKIEHCERCESEIKEGSTAKHIIDIATAPFPKEWKKENGWKIEKHVGNGKLELDSSKLRLHFSENQTDGKVIRGHKLRDELEADKVPVLNACVLEYLLANPELIPEKWKTGEKGSLRCTYFWGTIYRAPCGAMCVRCLFWDGGAWNWDYDPLDKDGNSQCPAAYLSS